MEITPTSATAPRQPVTAPEPQEDGEGLSSDFETFLLMLTTQMQNQDPLDPMDNSEMLQQIGQIREIGSTDKLSNTLTDFATTQDLVTASGLIGKNIQALSDTASEVEGTVDRVTVEKGEDNTTRKVKVHVGEATIDIRNIREILTQ